MTHVGYLMDSIILDFQYILGNGKNEYFVKELSYCPVGSFDVCTFHFREPYPWKQLKNINAIKCNQYIERRMGISWTDGNLDYNELENVLFELEKKTIYVKGREKVKFLEQYFSSDTNIINLEQVYDIPALRDLKNFKMTCEYHNYQSENYICAKENVINLIIFVQFKK
jgi:hypothetical protein